MVKSTRVLAVVLTTEVVVKYSYSGIKDKVGAVLATTRALPSTPVVMTKAVDG